MQIIHDGAADRITVVQGSARLIGWIVFVPLTVGLVVLAVRSWSETHSVFGSAVYLSLAALSGWLAALSIIKVVATFDGPSGSLTVRRERPWGTSTRSIAFRDVFNLETSNNAALAVLFPGGVVDYYLDILLADARRIRLRYLRRDQAEVDRAIEAARGMLRRRRSGTDIVDPPG